MIRAWDKALENLKVSLADSCQNITEIYDGGEMQYPALWADLTDLRETGCDLENNENAVFLGIELHSLSGTQTEASDVMQKACGAMREMGFVRTEGPLWERNAQNTQIFRLGARFERVVCAGDIIEEL